MAVLGWGEDGKLEPEETELARRLPPAPRREPVCGEDTWGDVLTAQIRIVPSAPPEATIVRSGPPWWMD